MLEDVADEPELTGKAGANLYHLLRDIKGRAAEVLAAIQPPPRIKAMPSILRTKAAAVTVVPAVTVVHAKVGSPVEGFVGSGIKRKADSFRTPGALRKALWRNKRQMNGLARYKSENEKRRCNRMQRRY